MKNTLLKTKLFLMGLCTVFALSCSPEDGEDGAMGPQGIAGTNGTNGVDGEDGADGAQGPQGVTGNANVKLYEYGSINFTSSYNFLLTNMPQTQIDSSLVLMYYNPLLEAETAWYPVPGAGPGGLYMTRNFWHQTKISPLSEYTVAIRTHNFDGTSNSSAKTFRKTRILIAPASQILSGGVGAKTRLNDMVDINDYYAVMDYFGLEY